MGSNCSTITSFTIPCTRAQANIAIFALETLKAGISGKMQASLNSLATPTDPLEAIIKHCYENHANHDKDQPLEEGLWAFDSLVGDKGNDLWIFEDQLAVADELAVFTQAVLKTFDLSELVIITLANTSESGAPGLFYGQTVAVTKESIRHLDDSLFVESEATANSHREAYYMSNMPQSEKKACPGAYILMACKKDDDPYEVLRSILDTPLGEPRESYDKYITIEVEPSEFSVLSQFHTVHRSTASHGQL